MDIRDLSDYEESERIAAKVVSAIDLTPERTAGVNMKICISCKGHGHTTKRRDRTTCRFCNGTGLKEITDYKTAGLKSRATPLHDEQHNRALGLLDQGLPPAWVIPALRLAYSKIDRLFD